MVELFHAAIYTPICNVLVAIVDLVGGDLGLAVIAVTLLVKLILVPVSISAVRTQEEMKVLQPKLEELKQRLKDDKEAQARETLALYKEHNVKPFASILMLFLQVPIVLGLYYVCRAVAHSIDPTVLYSFVHAPATLSPLFLGLLPVAGSSLILAVVAAVTQLAQAWYAIPVPPKSTAEKPAMQEELGRAMAIQARFVFPLLIGLVAYTSGVIALYFTASNLFMLLQEFFFRLHGIKKAPVRAER